MPLSDHLQLSKISEGRQILEIFRKKQTLKLDMRVFPKTILRVVIPDMVGIWLVNSKESVQYPAHIQVSRLDLRLSVL